MARVRSWTRAVVVATVVLLVVAVPAQVGAHDPLAGSTKKDLKELAARRDRIEAKIAATTARLDDLRARMATTSNRLSGLQREAAHLERQAAGAAQDMAERARTAFMGGGGMRSLETLLTSSSPQTAMERAGLLAALSRRDLADLQTATALRSRLDQTRATLIARKKELADLERDAARRGRDLQHQFADVSALYRQLKERREHQTRLAQGAQQGVYACIFRGAYSFRDTWGAPRSGGRSHEGTDLMAPDGAPVYAFTTGQISRMSSSGLGGIGLYLDGDDGVTYYYAHLKGYADGIHVGKQVEAGELVAYNGASGNASADAPHVHFEVHPGDGEPVNPYPWLTPVC